MQNQQRIPWGRIIFALTAIVALVLVLFRDEISAIITDTRQLETKGKTQVVIATAQPGPLAFLATGTPSITYTVKGFDLRTQSQLIVASKSYAVDIEFSQNQDNPISNFFIGKRVKVHVEGECAAKIDFSRLGVGGESKLEITKVNNIATSGILKLRIPEPTLWNRPDIGRQDCTALFENDSNGNPFRTRIEVEESGILRPWLPSSDEKSIESRLTAPALEQIRIRAIQEGLLERAKDNARNDPLVNLAKNLINQAGLLPEQVQMEITFVPVQEPEGGY